ncbi:MAG: TIGR03936 family radical SAM-associated protein [Chloroflexi bacterium]|nr:TIGR03936 family radical SAM-associated protein [Chloroflexota bacterium]
MKETTLYRYQLVFAKGEQVKYISHLDLMRLLERALRRADLPLDYSLGFNPRPKISIAAPLAVGVTGTAELMDITLYQLVGPQHLLERLNASLPAGVHVSSVTPAALDAPSLQSLVIAAEYEVVVVTDVTGKEIQRRIDHLLACDTLPRQRKRAAEVRSYDLRPLIWELSIKECQDGKCYLGMCLEASSQGAGRPEEVVSALELPVLPLDVNRSSLIIAGKAIK